MSTVDVGLAAEAAAAEKLIAQGFIILERNWRTKWCEVDIIARSQNVVWFVEVKYRSSELFGDGLEYIGNKKIQHMQRAAMMWVQRNEYAGEYTLGAIAVTGNAEVGELLEIIS